MIRKKHITLCFSLFLALSMVLGQLIPVTATDEVPTEEVIPEETGTPEPPAKPDSEPAAEEESGTVPTGDEGTVTVPPEPAQDGQGEEPTTPSEEPTEDNASYPEKIVKTRIGNAEIMATYDSQSGLPEEAAFRVEEVTGEAAEVYKEWANNTLTGDVTFAQFFDIWFEFNGEKVQPEPDTVKINIQYPEKLEKSEDESVSVVHFPDDAAIEVLDDATIDQTSTEVKQVELSATSFSVYGIVGEKEPVIEFTFYAPKSIDQNGNAEYERYSYTDKANNSVDTQFVANGSRIEYPGKPYAGFGDYVFEDWYYGEYDESGKPVLTGQKVDFETAVETTTRISKPIIAKYVQAKYGVFYDDMDGTVVLAHVRYVDGKIAAAAIKATPAEKNEVFVGWSIEKSGTPIKLDQDGNYTGIETNFYPVFAQAYTLTFSTGEGSYVKPQTVKPDERPTVPEEPHRTGYTFGGWYGDEACTKIFDFEKTLTASATVYAKWEPAETNYTVIYWLQAITDKVETDPKNYEYADSEVLKAVTGSKVSIDDNRIQNKRPLKDSKGNTIYSHKDEEKVVNGDGSTVVNVYYDREIITYIFNGGYLFRQIAAPSSSGEIYGLVDGTYEKLTYRNNGWYYWQGVIILGSWKKYQGSFYERYISEDIVLRGLYGTSLEQNGFTCPTGPWSNEGTGYPFITHFIDPGGNGRTTVEFTKSSQGSRKVEVYKQNIDGKTYRDEADFSQPMNSTGYSSWTFSEVINGFTVDSYWQPSSRSWVATEEGATINIPSGDLRIRYKRNSYSLNFKNGNLDHDTKKILFENSIKDHISDLKVPEYPNNPADADQYAFVGWFADPQCTTLVDFGTLPAGTLASIQRDWGIEKVTKYETMPSSNLEVYAGWYRKKFNVKLNLNGGSLSEEIPVEFSAQYGDELAGDYFTKPQREGYTFVGWALTETLNTNATEYWDPVRKVTSDTELTAVWKATGSFNVVYYDHEHAKKLDSLNIAEEKFADSSAVSLKKPESGHVPDNKSFHGWMLLDKNDQQVGNIYKPGESFVIDAGTMARGDKDIHVQMVVTEPGTTTLTYHKNVAGTGNSSFTVGDIAVNTSISGNEQKPISDFPEDWIREGYEFTGWNTMADGSGKSFAPGITDYAVSKDGPNNLYAQYRRFYTVTVKKTVNGSFGDRFYDFGFTVNGDIDKLQSFTLKSGNQRELKFYEDDVLDLSETAVEGYTTQIKITPLGGSTTTQNVSSLTGYTVKSDTEIEFINTKEGTVPTGINEGSMIPYLALIIAGIGLGITYVLILRRRQMYR